MDYYDALANRPITRFVTVVTARSKYVRNAVLLWECRLSICPSATLMDCDHKHWENRETISHITRLVLPYSRS